MSAQPSRAAIETPSGDIRAGPVVERIPTASAGEGPRDLLVVEIEGVRLRAYADEASFPDR